MLKLLSQFEKNSFGELSLFSKLAFARLEASFIQFSKFFPFKTKTAFKEAVSEDTYC